MRRLAHPALLLLVFCVGLAAGAWFSIGRRAAAFSAGVEQRLAETAATTPEPAAETQRAFSTDEEMLTAIMSAVSEDEPLLRAHRLHDLMGRLSSAELAALFERSVRVEDRDRRGVLLAALLTRWAAIDPSGAAAAVLPFRDRVRARGQIDWRSLDTAVAQAWAAAMPEAALAEAMAAPDARWARDMANAALQSLAEGDPARQLEALTRMPASRLRGQMCESAIKSLAEKDSAAAEARLDLLPEQRQRTRVQAEILGKLAERDPAAGLARLAALAPDLTPGTAATQLVTAILRAAGKQDATAALAAVEGLPEALQTQARGVAVVGWAEQDPVKALTWAAANGVALSEAKAMTFGDNGGASWQTLFNIAFNSDHAKTLGWLRTQPASLERDALLREGLWSGTPEEKLALYAELTPEGRVEAAGRLVGNSFGGGDSQMEPWVKAQPPGPARQAAIQALAATQTRNTPERLDTLADGWPAGPDRDAAMRGIAGSIVGNDPPRALDFARRVSDPVVREMTFENIASSWSYRDAAAARAWLVTAPELSTEHKRVLLRQLDER